MSVTQSIKRPLVVLTGPTAVGKTKLSIALAKAIGGEILSADSMQVYKHMDIGSAKIRPEEMQGVPHHLIDILEPWEEFNVVVFQKRCLESMEQIYDRGHIPILVGGTGFYIQAVLRGIDFTENEENTEYREKMEQLAKEKGPEVLHEMLRKIDPVSAENIHANNIKRTIRALEYYELTGEPISAHNEREKERIKDGYETVLGERGVTVSGGQKQRISIARALLKDAPILILDDSVSAVDTRTEKIILDNLRLSRTGKTTLLIAHRISTVERLDKIIFLEDGKVEAVGSHDQLYASCPEYRKMVDLQKLEDEVGGGNA